MKRYVTFSLSCAAVALIGMATADVAAQGGRGRGNQPAAAEGSTAPVSIGAVRIPRASKADGKPLAAGTYQIRVTTQEAQPAAPGQTPQYERWAEFLQGGQVKGREVVSVVPQSDISQVAEGRPPSTGTCRTELLKGNDYYRVWCARGGNHYLVHLSI